MFSFSSKIVLQYTSASLIDSAQQVGFFNIGSGIGQNTGFGSGRSVEIYDRVFSGIFFTFGYFRVCRVFSGISGFTHTYQGYFLTFNEG